MGAESCPEVGVARAKVGDDWRRLLLFVVDDFEDQRLNRFFHESGAWPLLSEGLAVALASFVVAVLLCIPLTLFVDGLIGNLGFLASLPLVVDPMGVLTWLGLVSVVACVATLLPARRASQLVIREALAQT